MVQAPQVSSDPASSPTAPAAETASDAVRAAVDELIGEGTAPAETPAEAAAPAGSGAERTPDKVEELAAGEDPSAELREMQAFARAQERWGRERTELATKAATAADAATKRVLEALQSEDPDGELARMGLSDGARRALVERMVLRHVPAEKADPALRDRIEKDQLRRELREMRAEFREYVTKNQEDRQKERQEAAAQQQAQQALETLHEAFRSAGDDLRLVRSRYGKRKDIAVRDALEVGRELAAQGKISTKMPNVEIARRIVKELDTRYREDFGLGGEPASTPAASPPPASRPAIPPKNAAEERAARTITRGATEVTRPPPAPGPRSEDEELADMAAEFARMRRQSQH